MNEKLGTIVEGQKEIKGELVKVNKQLGEMKDQMTTIGEDVSWMTNVMYSKASTSEKLSLQKRRFSNMLAENPEAQKELMNKIKNGESLTDSDIEALANKAPAKCQNKNLSQEECKKSNQIKI